MYSIALVGHHQPVMPKPRIKELLWEKKFKIAGAKLELRQGAEEELQEMERLKATARNGENLRAEMKQVKETISRIRHEVDALLESVD